MMISDFLKRAKQMPAVQNLIPSGMGAGFPILSISNGQLMITLPYYRVVMRPEDQTLIYPISHLITLLWDSGLIVAFDSLSFQKKYQKVDFEKPIGTFRHDAIKNLTKEQYMGERERLYAMYDKMIASIFSQEPYAENDRREFSKLIHVLLEPSLKSFYQAINPDFYTMLKREDL